MNLEEQKKAQKVLRDFGDALLDKMPILHVLAIRESLRTGKYTLDKIKAR
jgi:hypothetical protein